MKWVAALIVLMVAIAAFYTMPIDQTLVVHKKNLSAAMTFSDWPQYRGEPMARGVAAGQLVSKPKLLWKQKVGDNLVSSPSIVGDSVYLGSGDNKVYALDRNTGERRWSFEAQDVVEATPLVLKDRLYVGSADYFFYCLDAKTGALLWKLESDGKILGSATWALNKGKVVILMGSYDGFLYAIDADAGTVIWKFDSQDYVNGTPLVDDGFAYFGGCDEQLHGVEVSSGNGMLEYALNAPIPGTASKNGEILYVGTHGGRFIAYDLEVKKILWEITDAEDGFYATAAVSEKNLILAGRDKWLRHLNPRTGAEFWKINLRSAVDSSPLIIGDHVVVGTKGGKCMMFNLDTGESIWEYDMGAPIIAALSFANNVLYVSVKNGWLYAFGADDA